MRSMTRQPGDRNVTLVVGARLRHGREHAGLSQEKLGEVAGLDRSYVSLVERGMVNPTVTTVVRLATAIGINPGDVLDGLSV